RVPGEHPLLERAAAAPGDHRYKELGTRRKLSKADRLYASPCASGGAFWLHSGPRGRLPSRSNSPRWLAPGAAVAVAGVAPAGAAEAAATAAAGVAALSSSAVAARAARAAGGRRSSSLSLRRFAAFSPS